MLSHAVGAAAGEGQRGAEGKGVVEGDEQDEESDWNSEID